VHLIASLACSSLYPFYYFPHEDVKVLAWIVGLVSLDSNYPPTKPRLSIRIFLRAIPFPLTRKNIS
jgi:hypothetical protein